MRTRRRLAKFMRRLRTDFDVLKENRYLAQDQIVSDYEQKMGMQANKSELSFVAQERAMRDT